MPRPLSASLKTRCRASGVPAWPRHPRALTQCCSPASASRARRTGPWAWAWNSTSWAPHRTICARCSRLRHELVCC